jgi:dihydroorotase
MLEKAKQGVLTIEKVVEKMAHAPAVCFQLANRGFIREGYYADLVVIDPTQTTAVDKSNLLYKCGWSPFEGVTFSNKIVSTFVNGELVFDGKKIVSDQKGMRLLFNR